MQKCQSPLPSLARRDTIQGYLRSCRLWLSSSTGAFAVGVRQAWLSTTAPWQRFAGPDALPRSFVPCAPVPRRVIPVHYGRLHNVVIPAGGGDDRPGQLGACRRAGGLVLVASCSADACMDSDAVFCAAATKWLNKIRWRLMAAAAGLRPASWDAAFWRRTACSSRSPCCSHSQRCEKEEGAQPHEPICKGRSFRKQTGRLS